MQQLNAKRKKVASANAGEDHEGIGSLLGQ